MLIIVLLFSLLGSFTLMVDAAVPSEGGNTSIQVGFPAHYIVFEQGADGSILPVSYQSVSLTIPLQTLSESQLRAELRQPERNASHLLVRMQDATGRTLFQQLVSTATLVRGEFSRTQGAGEIDGHLVQADHTAFVVRLPQVEATGLLLLDSQLRTLAAFNLPGLIATTPRPQVHSAPLIADQQLLSGSPANRIDLVVMGDGYTEAESADFQADAEAVLAEFFSISPLSEYSNYYNLYILATASQESGADHPPYDEDCNIYNPTCCPDPEMLEDPLQGQMVNTAYDSYYCAYGIYRLLTANVNHVYTAAGAIPEWDQILLLVNDDTYGGSGYPALAIISTHESAVMIAQHEYGHAFANLADEYEAPYPGYPACSDLSTDSPCEANVTDISERAQIKWLPWILDSTPLPTPDDVSFDGLVGLFEGARYLETGMYRPGYRCLMRALGTPYCAVPSQEIVLTIYRGGWGIPVEGISLIEPGSTLPESTALTLDYPATQEFSAQILSPLGGPPVAISWLVDGVVVSGATSSSFTYIPAAGSLGLHEIKLRVEDMTALVNPLMAGDLLVHEHIWQVEVIDEVTALLSVEPVALPANGFSTAAIRITLSQGGLPLAGVEVSFSTTLGSLDPLSDITDEEGVAEATLTAGLEGGTAVVTVSAPSISSSVEVELIAVSNFWIPLVIRQAGDGG